MDQESIWSMGSDLSREEAEKMVKIFERRSRYPDQVHINKKFLNFLQPKKGEHLIEVGCGSGVLCRLVAPHLIPGGDLIGVELSSEIVSLAYKFLKKDNTSNLIKYEIGNAMDLKYEDNKFDGGFAGRLLLHVPDPQKVVSELKRVVKSGGKVVLMDWDFGTLAIDHSNRNITRKILNWRTDHKDGNNWSGRQLYRQLKVDRFEDISIKPIISIANDENNSLVQSLYHAASGALEIGIINQNEYDLWVNEITRRLKSRQFFASIAYFLVKGICP
ncbi:MAG: methyltransferase domain-containing protein [Candidatus Lokiarchaeota archaeon]